MHNLSKTFVILRAHNMKLNLEKCTFNVRVGKFSGFMILERGIELNLKKIQVVMEMPPPRTINDIQRLTGKVVALNRFSSRIADKCHPFFKALRTSFLWIKECQETFEELKLYLTYPPASEITSGRRHPLSKLGYLGRDGCSGVN